MKLLVLALVLFACKSERAATPDRWPEIERLATPSVPGGDGALLDKALSAIKEDDVPEAALDDAIAWRKAGGGLPWRAGRTMEDPRPLTALKLGTSLIERRSADPEAVTTALYLAQRMRAEAPALIDVAIGFTLAKKVVEAKLPLAAELAPTDAEARRGVAADALHFATNAAVDDKSITKDVHAHYTRLVLDAPEDRAAYLAHLEAAGAKSEKSPTGKLLSIPKLSSLVGEMFSTVDAYRAALK